MEPMTLHQRRLFNTYTEMQALAEKCAKNAPKGHARRLEFKHNGDVSKGEYPDIYDVTLRLKGMKNQNEELDEHHFMVYLPVSYPMEPPLIKWGSDIFHPNILGMLDPNDLTYKELRQEFDTEETMTRAINQDPRWAELLSSYVCLDALKENWTPSVTLSMLIVELANMIRYKTYNLRSVLNTAASAWAAEKEKTHSLPLDPHGLFETEEQAMVRVVVKGRVE